MNDKNGDLRGQLDETLDDLARLAHKMNNPLTSLMGRAQLLQMAADDETKVKQGVAVIEESAVRIAAHVRELAALVRCARERLAEAGQDDVARDATPVAETEPTPVG